MEFGLTKFGIFGFGLTLSPRGLAMKKLLVGADFFEAVVWAWHERAREILVG